MSEPIAGIYALVQPVIAALGIPYGAGKFMVASGQTLPDVFIEYSLISSAPVLHADNVEKDRRQRVQVSIFSRSGLGNLPDVTDGMVAAGFMPAAARELNFDIETGHFGLSLDYIYLMEE